MTGVEPSGPSEEPRPSEPVSTAGRSGRPSHRRRTVIRALVVTVTVVAVVLAPFLFLQLSTAGRRHSEVSSVPEHRVAIVFGAGITDDGRPKPFLAHRLDVAADLYDQGRVEKLLMTGDNSRDDYDEVGAMRDHVVVAGVDPDDVLLDHAGFDTYDSCYRAREIFGVGEAVLVTQDYHLPRAVHTCRSLGVESVGVGPSEWGSRPGKMVELQLREILADWKALWDLHVAHPEPKFLGPTEDPP